MNELRFGIYPFIEAQSGVFVSLNEKDFLFVVANTIGRDHVNKECGL